MKIFHKNIDKSDLKCYNENVKKKRSPLEGGVKMTCGKCKHCKPNDVCDGDCLCKAKGLEVSQDDDIRFYGDKNKPCEEFTPAG